MRHTWIIASVLFTLCSAQGFSWGRVNQEESEQAPTQSKDGIPPLIEIKGGYFFFSNSKMRKIFNEGGGDIQLCGSFPIYKWLQLYASVEYLERHGKSLGDKQKTRIWEVPLSLGFKPVIKITRNVHYYFTLGPRYFFVHTHNNSPYVQRKANVNGLGGFINTGFNFFPLPHFLIDIFGEFSLKRMHLHPSKSRTYGQSVEVGGLVFGGGLGYAF